MIKEFIRAVIVRIITLEAKAVLKKYKPNIIVVTGSVGKTSTKDATYAALKNHTFVRKSEKSYNSDIGAPLTILGVPNGWDNVVQWLKNITDGFLLLVVTAPYPQWLVVEVGADRPGDISKALAWIQPTVVITTRFPKVPVHVEFYDSPREVINEELFPLSRLRSGGKAVLNMDDVETKNKAAELPVDVQKITYGFSKDADVHASHYRVLKKGGLPEGISFDVHHGTTTVHVAVTGVIGKTHVYALLGGIAGALAVGTPIDEAASIGELYETPAGRLRLVEGIHGTTLIDDSYNASPIAVEEALIALQHTTQIGRRIAVLGDMLELGAYSVDEHLHIGANITQQVDILVTVGVRARSIGEQALHSGMPVSQVTMFERGSDAAAFILSEMKKGDVVLIKGSQSMRMERVTKALMKNSQDAANVLPRQDAEWLAR